MLQYIMHFYLLSTGGEKAGRIFRLFLSIYNEQMFAKKGTARGGPSGEYGNAETADRQTSFHARVSIFSRSRRMHSSGLMTMFSSVSRLRRLTVPASDSWAPSTIR